MDSNNINSSNLPSNDPNLPVVYSNKKNNKLDTYALWNLIYSIFWVLINIFTIIFSCIPETNPVLNNYWYINVMFSLISIGFGIFFIINLVYSILWCVKANKDKNNEAIACYIIGIFIPFIGMGYQVHLLKSGKNYK